MLKIRILAMAAAVVVSLASTAALADCAADVKDIEKRTTYLDARLGELAGSIEKLVGKAKEALAEGKKKKCAKIVKKAQGLLARTTF